MSTRSQYNSVMGAVIEGIHANNTICNLVHFWSIYRGTVNINECLRARASNICAVFRRVFCTICSYSWWICRSSRSSASDVSNNILNMSEKENKLNYIRACLIVMRLFLTTNLACKSIILRFQLRNHCIAFSNCFLCGKLIILMPNG